MDSGKELLATSNPTVSVVVGSYNRLRFLKLTIESIRKETNGLRREILVVDGGSTDGTIRWLTKQKDVVTLVQHNHGTWEGLELERRPWGSFMNLVFKLARGKYVCMLSDDCLVVSGAIRNGIEYLDSLLAAGRNVGALAFYYRDYPFDIQYKVHQTYGNNITVNHGLYVRAALEEVRFVDEEAYQFYFADTDLCLRLWERGYQCLPSPDSYVEHCHILKNGRQYTRLTRRNFSTEQADLSNFVRRWQSLFPQDNSGPSRAPLLKHFEDPANTARQFWPHLPLRMRLGMEIEHPDRLPNGLVSVLKAVRGGHRMLRKLLRGPKGAPD